MSKESAQVIKEFLQRNNVTITEFAQFIDVCRLTVYKYLKGGKIQRKVAKRINTAVSYHYGISIPMDKLLK